MAQTGYQLDRSDFYNELCDWGGFFTSREAHEAGHARHVALHERIYIESIVVDAVLRKSARVGFSGLKEREIGIITAYSAGADLPV